MKDKKLGGPMSMDMQIAMPDWPCKNCIHCGSIEYKGKTYSNWNSEHCDKYEVKLSTIDEGVCPDFKEL